MRALLRIASVLAFILPLLEGVGFAFQTAPQLAPPELRRSFEQFIGDDPAARAEALATIAATRPGVLAPLLEAYGSGLLERRSDGSLVIYLPRQEVGGRKVFPLVDPWTLDPLRNADGSPVYSETLGRNMLKPADADREQLTKLVSGLSINHPSPQRRRDAIIEAANRHDMDLLPDMRRQLQTDPDGDLSTTLRESIARIELVRGDPDARAVAARALGDLGTSRPVSDLQTTLADARKNGNTALATEVEQAIAKVESYQRKIRILQPTFAGLSLGSILVLLALGLSIIFGLMRVINLAHGEFMMVGAYTTYVIAEFFKAYLPGALFDYFFLIALPLAFFVSAFVGWICEFAIIQHLYGRQIETLLATWGISLLLIQTARLLFGDTTSLTPPSWLQGGWEVAPDLIFPLNRVFIIGFCGLCIVIVYYLVQRTRFGLLLRATTQDRPIAAALGVPIRWIDGLTFAFGAGLAGLAGATVPLFDKLNPNMGQSYIVDSFMVVVVGGVGKLAGAVTAGTSLGFLTKYIEPWLQAVYGKLAVLGLIILFLQWRPSGLFPHRGRLAED